MTQYFCCTLRRRVAVKEAGLLNGIEYLEVRDTEEPDPTLRQRTLFVRLLKRPAGLSAGNVIIDGGERIQAVPVDWAAPGDSLPPELTPAEAADLMDGIEEPQNVLVVRTAIRGDRSPYRFRLVAGPGLTAPPVGFDPQLVEVSFSFAVECPSDFDCLQPCACHPDAAPEIDIDYLVKDYQGIRRVMLERMSLLSPGWTERNPADVGVALVELLAYVADGLSYRQDAIATEAYIGTARSRVSMRRHARLVDYPVHDGCNARAWVQVLVTSPVLLPAGTPLLTRVPSLPGRIEPGTDDERTATAANPTVFETMSDAELDPRLEELSFWTWGEENCCLPEGATTATLFGHHEPLEPGMVLVLAETLSPTLLSATEVDSGKRCAVRLTEVVETQDPSGGLFTTAGAGPVDVTEIGWAQEDALPFSICLSAGDDDTATAVAWGNIVLADHGRTIPREELGEVPAPSLAYATTPGGGCEEPVVTPVRSRFRPMLAQRPLTWSAPVKNFAPASTARIQDARAALPALSLTTEPANTTWSLRRDLLNSDAGDRHAVVETEYDGTAQLRFGDGEHGAEPIRDVTFVAAYRAGNGAEGNVGAESISHVVVTIDGVTGCRNPMPALGGTDPETGDQIRRDAPHAFARQERAVTAADYAEVAHRTGTVQQAAASFRWTGSWRTVFVTADRPGARRVDDDFRLQLRSALERYRMAGYDLEVDEPRFVPVELELTVCVRRDHFKADVEQAVLQVLGSGQQPDGRPGLFNPDLFTFGQPVYLSSVYAAVHAVPGVDSVTITTFRRQHEPNVDGIETGLLPMGRLEIAQLDNNPNLPDRGVLTVTTGGGA
jgi:hypothetical protein